MAASPRNVERYWFARRFPVSDRRNSMSPVSREGWRATWMYMATLATGAVAWGVLLSLGWWWLGLAIFITATAGGAWYYITTARRHGDPLHTVADYKAGRVQ